jgi:hypothetical protein
MEVRIAFSKIIRALDDEQLFEGHPNVRVIALCSRKIISLFHLQSLWIIFHLKLPRQG